MNVFMDWFLAVVVTIQAMGAMAVTRQNEEAKPTENLLRWFIACMYVPASVWAWMRVFG